MEAFVYLPADPRLIRHAKDIENAQIRALKELSDDARNVIHDRQLTSDSRLFLGSTHAGTELIVIAGQEYDADDQREIKEIAAYGISMEKAARIYSEKIKRQASAEHYQPVSVSSETEEVKIDRLRKECQSIAYRISKLLVCEPKHIHMNFAPQSTMGLRQLEEKRIKLLQMLADAGR